MYKKILLPVDLEHDSSWKTALPLAVGLCKQSGATLHLLAVVADFGMSIISQYFPEQHKREAMEKALAQLRAFADNEVGDEIQTQCILSEGSTVYEVILDITHKNDIDLIVIAAHRPEKSSFLLGPNAARVVRHAKCSVFVVRN